MNSKLFSIKLAAVILILGLLLQGCTGSKLQNDPQQENQIGQAKAGGTNTGDPLLQSGDMHDNGQGTGESGSSSQNSTAQGNDSTAQGQDGSGGSGSNDQDGSDQGNDSPDGSNAGTSDGTGSGLGNDGSDPEPIDLEAVKPNEAGRIMVVMFHNFIEKYEKGDKEFTTTFDAFRELLDTLCTSGYRLIAMNDYLNGNINTPAGFKPIIFTFDDGTSGQFSLVEENGELKVNPNSAVAIMEEFNRLHPDFGLEGTFYVNLGNQTFGKTGTLEQRLQYLISKGFEIGNHTYSHINLKKDGKTAAIIQKEIGGNQKKMYELVPDYAFTTFSLPYGAPSKDLMQYVIKGEYEGTAYENKAIMEVGSDPAQSPFSVKFDPLSTHRVRSTGIEPVVQDLDWWLKNIKSSNEYVSDGDPDTVTIPESYEDLVDHERLGGRKLVVY